jgi:mannose-6-phosphate isomerase-like protein (cupin superfamily)
MDEAEFRCYAKAEGYDEAELRSLPANTFFDTHAHDRDLIVLITAGSFIVDYGVDHSVFSPGDVCHVASGVEHTDTTGPQGASYVLAWR